MTQTATPATPTASVSVSTPGKPPVKAGGMEGVVATASDICFIDGIAGRLVYRGYEIADLVEHATFEETAFLLWDTRLPNRTELDQLRADLASSAALPDHAMAILKSLPPTMQPMDALRTVASSLGALDADLASNALAADRRKAIRLTAQFPAIVTGFHRLREGKPIVKPDPTLSIAANFLFMLTGTRPHETLARVMDAALVLHAEHGMNASTFAARVIAATLADLHAAVTGALGALKGPLHGGANQDVMELLLTCADADEAERKVRQMLDNKQRVPGFGHRVYRTFDPRAAFLRRMSKQLGEAAGNTKWSEMSERLVTVAKQAKGLNPNVDFFSASTYYTMGIPLDLFTPIFAISRVAGWSAHVMEQHQNNRIIRPTDDYTGPFGLKVTPIEQRS
jgi:citrate synthase